MAIKPVLTTFLEEEVTVKLGRVKGAPRQVSAQAREIDWQCAFCGCQDANQFTRDGHYRRGLETGWGHQRSGKRVVVLVALGFWNDGSGRREVLDWEIASSEEHTEWEKLLNRLGQRGVQPEKGLQMVVRDGSGGLGEAVALVYGSQVIEQRCLFHKLRNVADKCRSEFKGKEQQEEKQQFLQQARAIYQAESAEQARERLAACAQTWGERAPESVATLERDFEQTIAYYRLPELARQWVRTTSLLERTNRQLRRKFRQVGSFGSQIGAEVAMYLQIKRLHARWSKMQWWEVSCSLYLDFRNLNP